MIRLFKYDVAISVAEEDKAVADLIAAALLRRKVKYYYYAERGVESWGEYIINITTDAFGQSSRYVLMLTSSVFTRKYWSTIERQVALANAVRILQLRLDTAPVDGLSSHVSHRSWQQNPDEVADWLVQKIRRHKRMQERRHTGHVMMVLMVVALVVGVYLVSRPKPRVMHALGLMRKMEKVLIDNAFYISNTEVTVNQYREFCTQQKKQFPPQPSGYRENGPVTNVSWYDAAAYCQWAKGRLPTEAEWELAAGMGLQCTYSGGNNASKVAVYGLQKANYVGTKKPNAFGLYDMTGNVAEWCENWFDEAATEKSVRGGAYNSHIKPVNELAIAYRSKALPDTKAPYIGFRVVWNNQ